VTSRIFHLVPESELSVGIDGGRYTPRRFEEDGFVHCTATRLRVLAVAHDYFAKVHEPLVVLEIQPEALTSRLVCEAPAPIPGARATLRREGELFPHVYGPIHLAAVTGAARLVRHGDRFGWPALFVPILSFLASSEARR